MMRMTYCNRPFAVSCWMPLCSGFTRLLFRKDHVQSSMFDCVLQPAFQIETRSESHFIIEPPHGRAYERGFIRSKRFGSEVHLRLHTAQLRRSSDDFSDRVTLLGRDVHGAFDRAVQQLDESAGDILDVDEACESGPIKTRGQSLLGDFAF